MEVLGVVHSYYFAQPWWLLLGLLAIPAVGLGIRSWATLGTTRRILTLLLRVLVILLLAAIMARLTRGEKNDDVTVIAIVDKSLSIPQQLKQQTITDLKTKLKSIEEQTKNQNTKKHLGVVDIAEASIITRLPSGGLDLPERNTILMGEHTDLAEGVSMAMAITPPESATRLLIISDGNQTKGDLLETAKIAASNGLKIDVLPLKYEYRDEVVFRKIAVPVRIREGEITPLRFVLESSGKSSGMIYLNVNNEPMDLDPDSDGAGIWVNLKDGVNVFSVNLPPDTRGIRDYNASFVPDDATFDSIERNNHSSAMSMVDRPGHILVVDFDGAAGQDLSRVLQDAQMNVEHISAVEFPTVISKLIDVDAIVLMDIDCSNFTYEQQNILRNYVSELGGGLVMTGGPHSFGAGGWNGSAIEDILPVDLNPPQKKQLPKGALILIMHSCEMPNGNLWGERVAIAAVNILSRLDEGGVLAYNFSDSNDWVYPLQEVGDKSGIINAIKNMQVGDMPDLGSHVQAAYDALIQCKAQQKHMIVISDGDPQPPSKLLLDKIKSQGITISTVGVFPHQLEDVQSLMWVAQMTGGRFYNIMDPKKLPQIFIKEAQVVKRPLIIENEFSPVYSDTLNDLVRGWPNDLPKLDGYVLTTPKPGLSRIIMTTDEGDPLLATTQAGMGRCVAFTSSFDTRWAKNWTSWPAAGKMWEQIIRWAARPSQKSEFEITTNTQGRKVLVNLDAHQRDGKFIGSNGVKLSVIAPGGRVEKMNITQAGPGEYSSEFEVTALGSYLLNIAYSDDEANNSFSMMQTPVEVPLGPEFRSMKDNSALLMDVAKITGGNVINDINSADLFDTNGLVFPQSSELLTLSLMKIWLVLFLLDIAARRVVIDFVAITRKAKSYFHSKNKKSTDADNNINRLKTRRDKLKKSLYNKNDTSQRHTHYQADISRADEAKIFNQQQDTKKDIKQSPKPDKEAENDLPQSHIDRLLKIKKKKES